MPVNRNRVIYSAAALFVSPNSSGQHFSSGNSGVNLLKQIPRVQSYSDNLDVSRTDVNQFGQLVALEQIITDAPSVTADFSYLLVDGAAEQALGFAIKGNTTFISGQLDGTFSELNYFLQVSPDGIDAIGDVSNNLKNVIAIGNGALSNYSINLAVGALPTATLSLEALNIKVDTGNNADNTIPAVNPINGQAITGFRYQLPTARAYTGAGIVSALRPGDLEFSLDPNASIGNILSGIGSVNIQSVDISVPLARETISRLGSTFAYAKPLQVPITTTMSISALTADLRSSNLADVICNDQKYNFRIKMKNPSCGGTGDTAIILDFRGAKLQSQSRSLDIGSSSTTDMTFVAQVAGVSASIGDGFYMSGSYTGGFGV